MLNRSYIEDHKGHSHYFTDSKIKKLHIKHFDNKDVNKYIAYLKALSDPTKLSIYLILEGVKEMAVTDIVNILDLSQSAVSHALSDLKKLGLVESHRCGQLICYSFAKPSDKKLKKLLLILVNIFEGR